ncbi:hypothetical protein [Corynebacterium sp. 335C]
MEPRTEPARREPPGDGAAGAAGAAGPGVRPPAASPRSRTVARVGGWIAAAVACVLSLAWQRGTLGDSGPVLWALIAAVSIIGLGVIALGARTRAHDLLVAGTLAFTSPLWLALGIGPGW